MAGMRMPAAEPEFWKNRCLLTDVPNDPASRYIMMVIKQDEKMPKCVFQVVPALHSSGQKDGGPEPVWLSQKAKVPAPHPAFPPGQIKLLETAMFSDSPTIWPSSPLWSCLGGGDGRCLSLLGDVVALFVPQGGNHPSRSQPAG